MAQQKHIIFICTGNTCRSPMAAALLRDALRQRGLDRLYTVSSAGVAAANGKPAAQSAVAIMADDYGLDLSTHRSALLDDVMVGQAAYIVVMTDAHKKEVGRLWPAVEERVFTLGEIAGEPFGPNWDVVDPYGGSAAEYRATAYTLHEAIQLMADRLQQM